MNGRSLLVLALLAGAASAEDAGSRRDAIRASLADPDPAVRAKGRAALDAFADERLELAKSLTKDEDPEVAGAAKEVLFEKCIYREMVDAKQFGEILQSIADPERKAADRKELFRKYLALGPEAAAHLAAELQETKAAIDLDLSPIRPGERRELDLVFRNAGTQAFWYDADGYAVDLVFEKFQSGRRLQGRRNLIARGSSDEAGRVLERLSHLRRVPPGSEVSMGRFKAEPKCCGEFQVVLRLRDTENKKVVFSGQEIPMRPPELSLARPAFTALTPRETRDFKAEILPRGPGGRPALRVTAEQNAPGPEETGSGFWWAATDADGRVIGHGGIPEEEDVVLAEPWGIDETRTEELESDPPAGTKTLWLGFNAGGDEQAVPEPLAWPLEPVENK